MTTERKENMDLRSLHWKDAFASKSNRVMRASYRCATAHCDHQSSQTPLLSHHKVSAASEIWGDTIRAGSALQT